MTADDEWSEAVLEGRSLAEIPPATRRLFADLESFLLRLVEAGVRQLNELHQQRLDSNQNPWPDARTPQRHQRGQHHADDGHHRNRGGAELRPLRQPGALSKPELCAGQEWQAAGQTHSRKGEKKHGQGIGRSAGGSCINAGGICRVEQGFEKSAKIIKAAGG